VPKPFLSLTVRENVEVAAAYGRSREKPEKINVILGMLDLIASGSRPAASLNSVQQKMLDLARALATAPRILLVDELAAGLNPEELRRVAARLRDFANSFRLIGSEKIWERGAALPSRLHWFETEVLSQEENLSGLAAINRELIARAEAIDSPQHVVLDMDSTEIPVYGQQENSAYNGHFESTCYHSLLLFNGEGDCLAAKLRPGNVHSAEDWEELLLPKIERQQELGKEVVFRADAAFAKPEIYEALEERGVKYAIRLPANDSLERDIAELLTRPVGRPSHKPVVWYKGFLYQAASWKTARRVVAKVEFHAGELFPRVGFIVTNLERPSRVVVRFYNKRGTAEQWIKEGKQAVKMTRLSCHRFRSNQVRLGLSVLAYNLGNLWRRLALPKGIENWSLTSLQQRLVKTGGRMVKHARYYWLLFAESHLTKRLFGSMLGRIAGLSLPAG
jgi:energy-coupling factor transporter ATP-binding protein EcfA2